MATVQRAAFDVLLATMDIDNDVDEREIEVLIQFLSDNIAGIDFDIKEAIANFISLSDDAKMERLAAAVTYLNSALNEESKEALLKFVYSVIVADNKVTDSEAKLLALLAASLGVDIEKILS